jgi:uncharacterized protein (TIGR03435 family)
VVAKGGVKMEPAKGNADFGDETRARSADAGPGPGRGRGGQGIRMMRGEINGANITAGMLADQLSRITGRSVIDKTGLSGSYDVKLKYTPEGTQPLPKDAENHESAPSDSERPSIFVAVQEQLGLKLESQKGPVELYIIERLEKPSEN